jgi:hypothetical protein
MAETVEELSCEWIDDDGKVITKQLDKVVLTKGAWATVMYLYQDVNRQTGEFSKAKARIQRYQKRNGRYLPHSKFNISSLDQAQQITDVLAGWIAQGGLE